MWLLRSFVAHFTIKHYYYSTLEARECKTTDFAQLVHQHLVYGMPACSTNLVNVINYVERLKGWHQTEKRHYQKNSDNRADYRIQHIHIHVGFGLHFLPLHGCGLRKHPYEALRGKIHNRGRKLVVLVMVVKIYWNTGLAFNRAAPFVSMLKIRQKQVWTNAFPHLPV